MISIQTVGNLAADPVERESSKGNKYVTFPIATDNQNGTIYLSCRAFGINAKNILQYLKKGNPLHIAGTISEISTYKAKDDTIKPSCIVSVDRFEFINGRKNKNDGN